MDTPSGKTRQEGDEQKEVTDHQMPDATADCQPTAAARFVGPRIGAALPVCCPHHSSVQRNVARLQDFPQAAAWGRFCGRACGQPLPWCGHECAKRCHAPHPAAHTEPGRCAVRLRRPCPEHEDVPLLCGDLHKSCALTSNLPRRSLAEALSGYTCEETVDYRRPECEHSFTLPCFKHKMVTAGHKKLPECTVKVHCQ